MTAGGTVYLRALDEAGSAIVSGAWPAGHVETVDGLVRSTGASRSIVREITRELAAAGLLAASPRIGLRILPRSAWDLLDLRVIRWRLAVGDREEQVRELQDVRGAVEPEVAALAAERRSDAEASRITAAADLLRHAALRDEPGEFLDADRAFHRGLFQASGAAMLAGLSGLVDTVLEDRVLVQRRGLAPSPAEVALHLDVAAAVEDRAAGRARESMRLLLQRGGEPLRPRDDQER